MEAVNNCSNCYWGSISIDDEIVCSRCRECEHESSPADPYPMWVAKNPSVTFYESLLKGMQEQTEDVVNHPKHYTVHPSGVECIQITEHMNFCLGNAIKYLWRAGDKHETPIEDLKKAKWYIEREISRLEEKPVKGPKHCDPLCRPSVCDCRKGHQ